MKKQLVVLDLFIITQLFSLSSFASVTGYEKHCDFPNSGKMATVSDTFLCIGSGATEIPISIVSAAKNLTSNMTKNDEEKNIYMRAQSSASRLMNLAQAGAQEIVLQKFVDADENLKNAFELLKKKGLRGDFLSQSLLIIELGSENAH